MLCGVHGAAGAHPKPHPSARQEIAVVLTLSPLRPAQIDNKFEVAGPELKGRALDNRLAIAVLIDGQGPYRFIVDSGTDTSVIGSEISRSLGLPGATPALLDAVTARQFVDRVKVAELKVGASTASDLELPTLLERDLGADGILEIDALSQQRLMLDMDNNSVRIEDGSIKWKALPDEIVIRGRRQRAQLILTQISVEGHQVAAIVDTGSETSIGNSALRDKLFRVSGRGATASQAIGVTGASLPVQLMRLDQVRVGPADLRGSTIAFADVPPFKAFGLSNIPAILLGMNLLRAFRRVSLDFKNRKVHFDLKSCSGARTRFDPYASLPFARTTVVSDGDRC